MIWNLSWIESRCARDCAYAHEEEALPLPRAPSLVPLCDKGTENVVTDEPSVVFRKDIRH